MSEQCEALDFLKFDIDIYFSGFDSMHSNEWCTMVYVLLVIDKDSIQK